MVLATVLAAADPAAATVFDYPAGLAEAGREEEHECEGSPHGCRGFGEDWRAEHP